MEKIGLKALIRRVTGVFGILMLAGFLAGLGACRMPHAEASQSEIRTSAERITLEWDPSASTVSSYELYFRIHGTTDWRLLGSTIAAARPEYTIQHSDMGNGEFDFAVAAVNGEGTRSDYHTSLDETATPDTGWYVIWRR